MKIKVCLTEQDIRNILSEYIQDNYRIHIEPETLGIQVKSKQNYRSEWESADIRLDVDIAS